MPTAWRIVKPYRVADAFAGEGGRLFGGRWNSVGTPMAYAAESKALAALEILSVVLTVPSVLIPGESNYLINPRHRNFGKLKIGAPVPFEFDPRLLKSP